VLLLQRPSLPTQHNHTYFSCGLLPSRLCPSSTSCISCACALLLPCRRPVSPAPAPYFFLADAPPLLRSVLPLPRLRPVSPIPCSSVLIPVSFRPRYKDPFVSYPVSFRLVPRVFSSRTPCLFVSYPVSFRLVPRVFSFRTPRFFSVSSPRLFVTYPVSSRPPPRVLSSPTSCNLVSNP